MFCPTISDECKKEQCMAWWDEIDACTTRETVRLSITYTRQCIENNDLQRKQLQGHADMTERFAKRDEKERILSRFSLEMFNRIPDLTEEEKAAVDEAYGADDADDAERILRQAGLLGGEEPL